MGRSIGYGYVERNDGGVVDLAHLRNDGGKYEVEVRGARHALRYNKGAAFDPANRRIRGDYNVMS